MTDGAWTKDRPVMPGMGAPESLDGTLEWPDVVAKLSAAKNYWISQHGPSDNGSSPTRFRCGAAFVNETVT